MMIELEVLLRHLEVRKQSTASLQLGLFCFENNRLQSTNFFHLQSDHLDVVDNSWSL